MYLLPIGVKQEEVRVVVVDVADCELWSIAISLTLIADKGRDFRVVVQLSSRACSDLHTVQPVLFVVAPHRLVKDMALQLYRS